MSDDEPVTECSACGFKTRALTKYNRPTRRSWDGESKHLCALCAATASGTSIDYDGLGSRYEHSADVLRTLCYIGNVLLAEIRKGRTAE